MLRVLIADDQIPDSSIRDGAVAAWAREQYPDAHQGIDAFGVMREAVRVLRDGCDVVTARRLGEAMTLIGEQRFDVAIFDLGWGATAMSRRMKRERRAGDLCTPSKRRTPNIRIDRLRPR